LLLTLRGVSSRESRGENYTVAKRRPIDGRCGWGSSHLAFYKKPAWRGDAAAIAARS